MLPPQNLVRPNHFFDASLYCFSSPVAYERSYPAMLRQKGNVGSSWLRHKGLCVPPRLADASYPWRVPSDRSLSWEVPPQRPMPFFQCSRHKSHLRPIPLFDASLYVFSLLCNLRNVLPSHATARGGRFTLAPPQKPCASHRVSLTPPTHGAFH